MRTLLYIFAILQFATTATFAQTQAPGPNCRTHGANYDGSRITTVRDQAQTLGVLPNNGAAGSRTPGAKVVVPKDTITLF